MSATLVTDVTLLVQEFWSEIFMPELMESVVLPSLVNKEYEGEIRTGGDTVKVSQILRPAATRKTVGVGHETFETTKLQTAQVDVVADQVFTAAYEFDSLAGLQSQLESKDSEIRRGLLEAMEIKLNEYLYSLVAPSTSSPDHSIASVTDFNAAQLLGVRTLASQAKWLKSKGWWLLLDPVYYSDLLNASTLTSKDYVDDMPTVAGQMVARRFGFNILEDNSAGMSGLSPTGAVSDLALAFSPDFMHLVLQKQPTFEISSQHANKRHGFIISATMVGGAKLGIDGDVKHIKVYNN